MAKITLTLEDKDGKAVELSISGDFENDLNKCTSAQKLALEMLALIKFRDGHCENGHAIGSDGACQTC